MALVSSNIDRQGIPRGVCSCGNCTSYALPVVGNACDFCGCRPPAHANLSSSAIVPSPVMAPAPTPVYTSVPTPSPIPSGPAPGMCALPGCSRPAYVDNGRALDYCGRTHSDEARKRGLIAPPASPTLSKTCALPGCSKPVASGFDYCGRTHANDAKNQPTPSPSPSSGSGGMGGSIIVFLTGPSSGSSNANVCLIPGCGKPVYVDSSSGKQHDFCSVSHANQGKAQGLSKKPSSPNTSYVKLLSQHDPKYRDIKDQFQSKFLHTTPPAVVSILKIHASQALVTRYENYRKKIIAKRPELAQGGKGHAGPGNEQRRFHGTSKQACDLGMNGNDTLCNISGCACCGIIRTGLMLSKAQTNISFGRFGRGLYLTSTSSKSHGYNAGTSAGLGRGYRAMFVCKVIVGKGKKLLTDHVHLTCAPDGCDSVLGEVGTALNYDEIIVYDEDAVLPAYMVVYRE